MDLHLEDRVVIVTGGARGIGRAAAEAFLREGARVMICSARSASTEAALKDLRPLGTIEG
ncbi:MAG TPA: SDR family NAD(P)-dependent oxidoreductase, partial [Myxococcota bacterium]